MKGNTVNEIDFFKKIDEINDNVVAVKEAVRMRLWKSFLDGLLRGLGSVIGIVLALVLLGWFLNIIGVIPAFKDQVNQWKDLIDRATSQQQLPSAQQLQQLKK